MTSTARLPLRAMDFRTLNRDFWSQGKTVYQYERREPRGIEVPVEDMSLEDLIATQQSEPLSESRRAFLTTGKGCLSLDMPAATSEEALGTIAETIADDSPLRQFEAIEVGDDPEDVDVDWRRFTPYVTVDPITARQIEWEQCRAQDGALHILKAVDNPDTGKVSLASVGRPFRSREDFLKAAKHVKNSLVAAFGTIESVDDLHARVDMIRDAMDGAPLPIAPDIEAEQRALRDPAEDIAHSSYEYATRVRVVAIDEEGNERIIGQGRVIREVHRNALRSKDEFWHHRLAMPSDYELGTYGLVDDYLQPLSDVG